RPMSWARRAVLAGLAGLAAAGGPARAHRLHMGLTTIDWRAEAGRLEVVHRFYAHDMAAALGAAAPDGDLAELRARAHAALYVAEQFRLADGETPLTLDLIGAELEGEYLFVYQEIALLAPPAQLGARAGALLDALPGQVNTVNIDLGAGVRTLEFRAGDPMKRLGAPDG
ncbi:MAG: hypothetical protein MI723_13125, partial [Caulobacterales bacterium]|nr:hypothetical protein [Caulobacterales bacterium]